MNTQLGELRERMAHLEGAAGRIARSDHQPGQGQLTGFVRHSDELKLACCRDTGARTSYGFLDKIDLTSDECTDSPILSRAPSHVCG